MGELHIRLGHFLGDDVAQLLKQPLLDFQKGDECLTKWIEMVENKGSLIPQKTGANVQCKQQKRGD